MKRTVAILLCIAMLAALCGCGGGGAETTVPPTTVPAAAEVYAEAAARLAELSNAELVVSLTEYMDLGEDHYKTESKYSVTLLGMGTDAFAASSKETIFSGSVTLSTKEIFHNGAAYTTIGSGYYKSELTAQEYLEEELPLMLVDASLYSTIEQDDSGIITFTGAEVLEAWCDTPYAILESVTATAELGEDGLPAKYTYEASYTQGASDRKLSVTMQIKTPETTEITAPADADKYQAVEKDENGLTMADIAAQIYLTKGYLDQAGSVISSRTDSTVCYAGGFTDTTVYTMATYGRDDKILASFVTTNQFTDLTTNSSETSTMTETFRDGTFTAEMDGQSETTTGVTGGQVQDYAYEELIYLFPDISDITGYTLSVVGDTALLEYTFTDAYGEEVEANNCQYYWGDSQLLRSLASEVKIVENTGYMGIDLTTGLPLSMAQSLAINHTIDGQDYTFAVVNQMALQLGSPDAYETITGEPLPAEEPEEQAKPVFYKVTGTNGETMWLLGTIHVGDERTAFLPQEIYDAFAASDALALEFDMDAYTAALMEDEEAIQAYIQAMIYTDGTSLSDHLTDETLYEDTIKLLKATGNYNASMAELTKAVFQAQTIENCYMANGYRLSADYGVDTQLQALAKEQEKEVLSVESGEFQMDMLSNFSDALQELMLKESLEYGQAYYNYSTQELFEMWCRGDESELIEYLNEEADDSELTEEEKALYEEYENAMSSSRNDDMLTVAQDYLNSGKTVFYAVGLAHLLADDGLVNTLRDAGYTVELVAYAE